MVLGARGSSGCVVVLFMSTVTRGRSITAVKCPDDIGDPGQVDILVNNAGLALGAEPAHEQDTDAVVTMLETNVTGLIALTRQLTPGMVERKRGHIVNMSSVAGIEGYPGACLHDFDAAAPLYIWLIVVCTNHPQAAVVITPPSLRSTGTPSPCAMTSWCAPPAPTCTHTCSPCHLIATSGTRS